MDFLQKWGLSSRVGTGFLSLLLMRAVMVHLNLPSADVITPVKTVFSQFLGLMPFLMLSRADFMSL